jgi:hypothetical protein
MVSALLRTGVVISGAIVFSGGIYYLRDTAVRSPIIVRFTASQPSIES